MRGSGGIARRGTVACAAAALVLAGCGGGKESQDENEPSGTFPVDVVRASFPTTQRLADRTAMEIVVRNAGERPLPNVAVTIGAGAPGETAGPTANAFAQASEQQNLADPSRPIWIVDSGPRGGITAYTNTWALGRLGVGQTRTFRWQVTAIKPGTHTVTYRVAAGLDGKAKAQLAGGQDPTGSFTVTVSGKPADARIDDDGRVVVTPRE